MHFWVSFKQVNYFSVINLQHFIIIILEVSLILMVIDSIIIILEQIVILEHIIKVIFIIKQVKLLFTME